MAGRIISKTWLGVFRDLDPGERREIALAAYENPNLEKALNVAIASHYRVRRQSVERWSIEKRAEHLSRMRRISSAKLAAAMLSQFHLVHRKKLVTWLLDFLKIPHRDGLIPDIRELDPPPRSRLVAALRRMISAFPRQQVTLFLDVISCQSEYRVWSEFDDARFEALGDEETRYGPPQRADPFSSNLTQDFATAGPKEPETASPAVDETPQTFTTLDQILMRTVIASVADVHGSLTHDKAEDLVEEVIQLNLDRHESYFHRGFLAVLLGRGLELDFPEASDVRRAWYACGAIVAYQRRAEFERIVELLATRPDLARELTRPGTGYAERVVGIVFDAFKRTQRFGEMARYLEPTLVGRAGPSLALGLLETASLLIRERREAEARALLEILVSAQPLLRDEPDLPPSFSILLQRRRAHCARLRGDFATARQLLEPQLTLADEDVRADILADLGLIECGLRSLADVRLPPEEGLLPEFGAQFEKGWSYFVKSASLTTRGRNHGDFCMGMALFARGEVDKAVSPLERAVAGMAADPERYGRFGPLDGARIALAVALAEQTDLARVPYARDLIRQALEARARIPEYALRRALSAIELVDPDASVELATDLYASLGARSLPVLIDTRLVRHVDGALDALLESARSPEHSDARRFDEALVVLKESHAMRDAPSELPGSHRERATEAFDTMVELATEPPERERLLALLDEPNGPWRSALEPIDARILRATLLEHVGEFEQAASELAGAFHSVLDADDEWALGKAEALLDDIRALGGAEAASPLEPRLAQYKQIFERRSQSGLVVPPTADPADFYGLILIIGGNETQAAQDASITSEIKETWPNANLVFERTGWSSNWGDQLRTMEGEIERARALVVMRYVRTSLGRAVRKLCGELDIPWVACTGSGRASMVRAIEQAILLAWRQSGELSAAAHRE
ncbi:MAG: hypothetical protein AB7P00_11310 [Sandaracinaceae bacterium]